MFEKGNWIVCEHAGICQVEEVGCNPPLSAADPKRKYYKLSPLEGSGKMCIRDSPLCAVGALFVY